MLLGIEIGGTKLQLGVGPGDGSPFTELVRLDVDLTAGAPGILEQIQQHGSRLVSQHQVHQIGIGFGGPVDSISGQTVKSHQVHGWENFPLAAWSEQTLRLPTVIGNDCDVAALAEATFGAGRKAASTFYVTVGTGVGGGYVNEGRLQGAGRPAIAEIGHLRPGPAAESSEDTVESVASGLGLGRVAANCVWPAAAAPAGYAVPKSMPTDSKVLEDARRDMLERCQGEPQRLNGRLVAEAASQGNPLAAAVVNHGCRVLGWAIGQVVTLLAPQVVVVGGGVSLMGEDLFFAPLRHYVDAYTFPPLRGSYTIVPAELGELVVVHGALALAASRR